ncbi:sigma-E factor regulator, RseC/MucC family [Gottschalkia acidurici 9a]|uniref:Sigma-E factor regulator, RseC/MucC family n=1 Tax=Gottschalkia acidurici (strain ATCC 7906 / DSM 604 / BCRC 14475 / CIP 104303 / KCTC 5404 / NCIMB 10678 / 9a) TaxID=1128398 RepID=K0AZN4_GOTA9|nr:SoxR reducing system RseC family protein [Gottschalkia acidurici]AFS78734.1 sigma-E factor regulator, RseC/MucC family [Gottschalkia acidurici 9a]
MQQKGYVVKADDEMAQVIIKRESACGHSCDTCGGGCSSPSISLNIENKLGAKTGDYVLIESKSSTILKSAFIAYIIPLILMIIGVSIGMKVFNNMGYENYETLSFLTGLVFVVISYFLLKYVDNKYFRDNDSLLEMVEILDK